MKPSVGGRRRRPAPGSIAGATLLLYVPLTARTVATGHVRHSPHGGPPIVPSALAIGRYPGERSVYLFYCDRDWTVLGETWHPRIEEARAQAEREYEGIAGTWRKPPPAWGRGPS